MNTTPTQGGGSIERTIRIEGGGGNSGPPDISKWYAKVGEVTSEAANFDAIGDRILSESEARGVVVANTGQDAFSATGAVTVHNFGYTEPLPPETEPVNDPEAATSIPINLVIDGEEYATVKVGEAVTVDEAGTVTRTTASTAIRDDPEIWNSDGSGGSGGSGGGLLSLIPGLLPGVGPLNSSQTTAAAILLALAVAGTLLR